MRRSSIHYQMIGSYPVKPRKCKIQWSLRLPNQYKHYNTGIGFFPTWFDFSGCFSCKKDFILTIFYSDSVEQIQMIYDTASKKVKMLLQTARVNDLLSDAKVMKELIIRSKNQVIDNTVNLRLQDMGILQPDLKRRKIKLEEEVYTS